MRNKLELKKLITVLCALCEHEIKHSATARENLQHKNLHNNTRVNYPCFEIMTLCYTTRRHTITMKTHERLRVPMRWNFFILPAALWPWGRLSL
jgi:hypothetical protein